MGGLTTRPITLDSLCDIFNNISDSRDALNILIFNLKIKFLFNSHDQFNHVKRIGIQIFEFGIHRNVVLVHGKLLRNQGFDFFKYHLVSPRNPMFAAGGPPAAAHPSKDHIHIALACQDNFSKIQ